MTVTNSGEDGVIMQLIHMLGDRRLATEHWRLGLDVIKHVS